MRLLLGPGHAWWILWWRCGLGCCFSLTGSSPGTRVLAAFADGKRLHEPSQHLQWRALGRRRHWWVVGPCVSVDCLRATLHRLCPLADVARTALFWDDYLDLKLACWGSVGDI